MANDTTPVILLTWNPDVTPDDVGWFDDLVVNTKKGKVVEDRWTTGNRKGGAPIGTRAYLVKQGSDRGIVASGTVVKEIFQPSDKRAKASPWTNFVMVEWDVVLPVAQRIKTEDLIKKVPDIHWNALLGSGVMPPCSPVSGRSSPAKKLNTLWDSHVAKAAKRTSSKQG